MKNPLRLAILQLTSTDDVEANLANIRKLAQKLPGGLDIVFLPENCLFMRIDRRDSVQSLELDSEPILQMKSLAQGLGTSFHLGSVALRQGSRVSNASMIISPSGEVKVSYEKIHLFDVDIQGQAPIRESDAFARGRNPEVWYFKNWSLGQSICYDLRFSELFSFYARECCDVLLVPAAFLRKTGEAHWEVLLRARAIESQCYVIAAAQAGIHRNKKGQEHFTFGQSLVVDPWGHVLVRGSSDQSEVLEFQLDPAFLEQVRRQIPMHKHRQDIW